MRIEAILYLKARPLRLTDLIDYAQCDREAVQSALIALMEDYSQRQGALEVVETSEGFSLQLRSGFEALVQTLIPVDLGVGALRTLAAIALKKGITQTELVDLRGSGAYQQVQALVEQGFVQKRRHKETRSYWLQVTDKFHRYFQTQKLPKPLSAYSRTATSNPPPALDSPEFEHMPLETEELADDLG
ncbi:MAG: SMC-Scp complex subunit ScpB [Prochlorothrix sp.]